MTLVADDVEARCARLDPALFERRLVYNPEIDITHVFLRDFDGHLVETQRFEQTD